MLNINYPVYIAGACAIIKFSFCNGCHVHCVVFLVYELFFIKHNILATRILKKKKEKQKKKTPCKPTRKVIICSRTAVKVKL